MLRRLWRRIRARPVAPQASRPADGRASAEELRAAQTGDTGALGVGGAELDDRFAGLVLGVSSSMEISPNRFESRVLAGLGRLCSASALPTDLVPRTPGILPRLWSALHRDGGSFSALAELCARDPVLVREVLRLANSPYYRGRAEVTGLEQALVLLGEAGIRQVMVNATFRPLLLLDSGHFARLAAPLLWTQGEWTARLGDCLARRVGVDRFTAYLSGIAQNIGFTVALRVLDRHFTGREAPRSRAFRERFVRDARALSVRIVQGWEFPAAVGVAVREQGGDRARERSPLGEVLYAADKLSKLQALKTRGAVPGTAAWADPAPCAGWGDLCRVCARTIDPAVAGASSV